MNLELITGVKHETVTAHPVTQIVGISLLRRQIDLRGYLSGRKWSKGQAVKTLVEQKDEIMQILKKWRKA